MIFMSQPSPDVKQLKYEKGNTNLYYPRNKMGVWDGGSGLMDHIVMQREQ